MNRRKFLSVAALTSAAATPSPSTAQIAPAWYAQTRGLFAKSLPHDAQGGVAPQVFAALGDALRDESPSALERLPIVNEIRLVNPLAGAAFKHWKFAPQVQMPPPPPAFDSDELAEQAIELYWMALLRDEKLLALPRARGVREAAAELTATATYKNVTPEQIFRLPLPAAQNGYPISLLLWMPIPYGAHTWWQAYKTPMTGQDFLTDPMEWLRVQNGQWPKGILQHLSELQYLRTGRELAEYVRWDFSFQAFINAAHIMLGDPHFPRKALHPSNPYKTARTQNAFVSFGSPAVLALIARAADLALQAAWQVKWNMFPLLRPEEYGGLVERNEIPAAQKVRNSEAGKRVKAKFGNYLLPQAYPEGAPAHPSYVSGHAAIAGACATVLKAFVDPNLAFRFPLEPTFSGRDWGNYEGPPTNALTEIDKLAANICEGRQWAGIHWRCDSTAGLKLGEQVGLAVLREAKENSIEAKTGWFAGFEVQTFDQQSKVKV